MQRVLPAGLTCALAVTALLTAPAAAAAQQSVNFYVGGFVPRAEDARDAQDVLVKNHAFLNFNLGELTGPIVGGDWLIGLGDKFDASLGVGFYQRSTPAADKFKEFEGSGDPIIADLKLRVVPLTATIRFLPLGRHDGIQPYIGGGVGAFAWRYSEVGDFVASDNKSIINGRFVGSGTSAGPVILGGVRVPIGSGGVGGEIRYQSATGNLPADQKFAGSTIDLGGMTYVLTVNFKF